MYTTYFAKLRSLSVTIVPIAISRSVPDFYKGLRYTDLAPSWDLLNRYKASGDWAAYTEEFNAYLSTLVPSAVVRDLIQLAGTDKIALVCYEGKDKPCHRHLVAKWLRDNMFDIVEY